VYVLFGSKDATDMMSQVRSTDLAEDLSATGRGFKIFGANPGDNLGHSVSDAGDVNKDCISDIIIGANMANGGRGIAYIIYGKKTGLTDIDLAEGLSKTRGFRVLGDFGGDGVGSAVSKAGDINKDGVDDIIIGAPGVNANAGIAYVIYGKKKGLADVDLAQGLTEKQGFRVLGGPFFTKMGYTVSNVGDVNKDGIHDIIIGATGADSTAGNIYVIYGKKGGLSDIQTGFPGITPDQGYIITGAASGDQIGFSLSAAGDVNKDGCADFIIGAPTSTPNRRFFAGSAYVILGTQTQRTGMNLRTPLTSTEGFKVIGETNNGRLGYSVSGAGDINKDGVDDIMIGAPLDAAEAGVVYVIYDIKYCNTKKSFIDIDVANSLGDRGFEIVGAKEVDRIGWSVSRGGDFNKDGRADLLMAGNYASPVDSATGAPRTQAGIVYVVSPSPS
jgi:hypothetical protein